MKATLLIGLSAATWIGASASCFAAPVVLTFEGLGDQTPIDDYYNGGGGGSLGVTFSSNALAIINTQNGGTGNFAGNPSGKTILFYLTGASAILNNATGFNTGFSFYYSAINNPGSIGVYTGLNGTGTLIATLALPTTPSVPPAAYPSEAFDPFIPIGVAFSGTAQSIAFSGVQNQIGFDDITFGSATPGPTPTPEPASITTLLAGLAALGVARRRRT